MLEINSLYDVEIEENNIFSNGVCHINEQVVFVSGAVVGDVCKIRIKETHQRYAYAEIVEVLSPSKKRITPSCDVFGSCGGCSFLNSTIDDEHEIKNKYLVNTFKKNGIDIKIENIKAPKKEKYRNKVVYFIKDGKYGFLAKATNKIIPHNACILCEDIFEKIASFTMQELKNTTLRALFLRKTSNEEPDVMVCPIFYKSTNIIEYTTKLISKFPNVKTVLYSVYPEKDFVLEKAKLKIMYGDGYLTDELLGLDFRISPHAFYQVNHACAEMLYEKAIELAELNEKSVCADLFCGTGTIGILCAKKTGAKVFGVEINESAVKDAKFNAKLNGVKDISFEAIDAKNFKKSVDVAIIDPPRKGCTPFMLEALMQLSPKRIVYVSCNAETLARDLKTLLKCYQISSPLYPYNMFPRTAHVESVISLARKEKSYTYNKNIF